MSTPSSRPRQERSWQDASLQPRWRPGHAGELAFWLLPVAGFLLFPDYRVLGSQVLIAGLFALSLDLCLGYAGIITLGHAAFYGVGAYTAGLLASHGWHEPLSAVLAASASSALVGFITSFLVVDRQGLARLMVSLGIGFLLHEVANRASSVTGGTDGLSSLVLDPLLGRWRFELSGSTAYVYAGSIAFLGFLISRRVARSPFGLALQGIRENPLRMPALGVPVRRRLISVYTLAAALAGVAGALSAQTTGFVGLEALGFERSASVLIMLVLGGTGRLYGAFAGSTAFLLLRHLLSEHSPAFWQFWLGALVVLLTFFARGGLLGAAERLLGLLPRRPAVPARAQGDS